MFNSLSFFCVQMEENCEDWEEWYKVETNFKENEDGELWLDRSGKFRSRTDFFIESPEYPGVPELFLSEWHEVIPNPLNSCSSPLDFQTTTPLLIESGHYSDVLKEDRSEEVSSCSCNLSLPSSPLIFQSTTPPPSSPPPNMPPDSLPVLHHCRTRPSSVDLDASPGSESVNSHSEMPELVLCDYSPLLRSVKEGSPESKNALDQLPEPGIGSSMEVSLKTPESTLKPSVPKSVRCFRCGGLGHLAKTCSEKRTRFCSGCGRFGHRVKQCWGRKRDLDNGCGK